MYIWTREGEDRRERDRIGRGQKRGRGNHRREMRERTGKRWEEEGQGGEEWEEEKSRPRVIPKSRRL